MAIHSLQVIFSERKFKLVWSFVQYSVFLGYNQVWECWFESENHELGSECLLVGLDGDTTYASYIFVNKNCFVFVNKMLITTTVIMQGYNRRVNRMQKERLVEIMESHFTFLYGGKTQQIMDKWQEVANTLNGLESGCSKKPEEWKNAFSQMRVKVKSYLICLNIIFKTIAISHILNRLWKRSSACRRRKRGGQMARNATPANSAS